MLNESKREEIAEQARELLKKFSESLGEIKAEEEIEVEISEGFRAEGSGMKAEKEFRKQVFANSPESEGDYFIAEKKRW